MEYILLTEEMRGSIDERIRMVGTRKVLDCLIKDAVLSGGCNDPLYIEKKDYIKSVAGEA